MVNHMPRVHTAGLALWIVFLYVFPMTARAQIETASHQNFGKQVLTLREKQSGRRVHLVGTMHYNPASALKAQQVVEKLADSNKLSSVVIEMCPKRFTSMEKNQPRGSSRRRLLDNEMQVAADAARDRQIEIVLGDQCIGNITENAGNMLKNSLSDLITPTKGWPAIARDFRDFLRRIRANSDAPTIKVDDIADPLFIMGTPVSLLRYPLALFLRQPLQVLGLLLVVELLDVGVPVSTAMSLEQSNSIPIALAAVNVLALVANVIFTVVLARIILVVMLKERDEVLAKAIQEACNKLPSTDDSEVVAILGMAHCNGVARLLAEEG